MRSEDLTELAHDLEELRDVLCDASEDGEAMPRDAAMRGAAALDLILSELDRLRDD